MPNGPTLPWQDTTRPGPAFTPLPAGFAGPPTPRNVPTLQDLTALSNKQADALEQRAMDAHARRSTGAPELPDDSADVAAYAAFRTLEDHLNELKANGGQWRDHFVPRNVVEAEALAQYNAANVDVFDSQLAQPGADRGIISVVAQDVGAVLRSVGRATAVGVGAFLSPPGVTAETQDMLEEKLVGPSPATEDLPALQHGVNPGATKRRALINRGESPVGIVVGFIGAGGKLRDLEPLVKIPLGVAKVTKAAAEAAYVKTAFAITDNIESLVDSFKTFSSVESVPAAIKNTLTAHFTGFAAAARRVREDVVPGLGVNQHYLPTADDLILSLSDPRAMAELASNGARWFANMLKGLTISGYKMEKYTDPAGKVGRRWVKTTWNVATPALHYLNADPTLLAHTPTEEAMGFAQHVFMRNTARIADSLNAMTTKLGDLPAEGQAGAPLADGSMLGIKRGKADALWWEMLRPRGSGIGGKGTKALTQQAGVEVRDQYAAFSRSANDVFAEAQIIAAQRGMDVNPAFLRDAFERNAMYQRAFERAMQSGNNALKSEAQLDPFIQGLKADAYALTLGNVPATAADKRFIDYEVNAARQLYLQNFRTGADPHAIVRVVTHALLQGANELQHDELLYSLRAIPRMFVTEREAEQWRAQLAGAAKKRDEAESALRSIEATIAAEMENIAANPSKALLPDRPTQVGRFRVTRTSRGGWGIFRIEDEAGNVWDADLFRRGDTKIADINIALIQRGGQRVVAPNMSDTEAFKAQYQAFPSLTVSETRQLARIFADSSPEIDVAMGWRITAGHRTNLAKLRLSAIRSTAATPDEMRALELSRRAYASALQRAEKDLKAVGLASPFAAATTKVRNMPRIAPRSSEGIKQSADYAALAISRRFPKTSASHFDASPEFVEQYISDLMYPRNFKLSSLATYSKVVNAMSLAYDASSMFVTGALLLPSNPEVALRSWGWMLRAIHDPRALSKFMADPDNAQAVLEMTRNGMGLKTETSRLIGQSPSDIDKGGQLLTQALRKYEVSGNPLVSAVPRAVTAYITGTQRGFDTWGDVARVLLWRSLRHNLRDADDERALADFVAKMTGMLDGTAFGRTAAEQQIDSIIWRTPRYMRAGLGFFADMAQGGLRGQLARSAFLDYLGGITFLNFTQQVAVAYSKFGADADWDTQIWPEVQKTMNPIITKPNGERAYNSRFMTFNIGNYNFSPAGGIHFAVLSAAARAYANGASPDKFWSTANPIYKFWRFRSSAASDGVLSMFAGEDAIGQQAYRGGLLGFAKTAGRNYTPVWSQPLWDVPEGMSIPPSERALAASANFIGWRTFEQGVFDRRAEARQLMIEQSRNDPQFRRWVRDEYYLTKLDNDQMTWEELPPPAQAYLLRHNTPLKELDAQIAKDLAKYGDENSQAIRLLKEQQTRLGQIRTANWASVERKVRDKTIAYADAYEQIGQINADYARSLGALITNTDDPNQPQYQRAQEYLDGLSALHAQANPNDKGALFDAAYDEYMTKVVGGNFSNYDENGAPDPFSFNSSARRAAVDAWLAKWQRVLGKDVLNEVQTARRFVQDAPPIVVERDRAAALFTAYFDSWRNLPMSPQKRIYERYIALKDAGQTRAAADMLLGINAQAIRDIEAELSRQRRAIRELNPTLDAELVRWGKVTAPLTSAAYNLLRASETPTRPVQQ